MPFTNSPPHVATRLSRSTVRCRARFGAPRSRRRTSGVCEPCLPASTRHPSNSPRRCSRMSTPGKIFSGSSDAYDRFMGRYSTQLAPAFADFAGVAAGMRVLDVGAGTGALTQELVARLGAENVAAAEPSPDYATVLRERFPGVEIEQAPAGALPWENGSFD